MGDVVNLRRARKAKVRSEQEAAAAANRVAFGRSKAETCDATLRRAQAERHLDNHRRDTSGDDA